MRDRIVLSGMEFHAFHGVYPEEGRLGARFSIDVELSVTMNGVDSLEDTIDYSRVYAYVKQEVTGKRFALIEALAVHLADGLLTEQPLAGAVTVRVHKPAAPLPGIVRDVFAEANRKREA